MKINRYLSVIFGCLFASHTLFGAGTVNDLSDGFTNLIGQLGQLCTALDTLKSSDPIISIVQGNITQQWYPDDAVVAVVTEIKYAHGKFELQDWPCIDCNSYYEDIINSGGITKQQIDTIYNTCKDSPAECITTTSKSTEPTTFITEVKNKKLIHFIVFASGYTDCFDKLNRYDAASKIISYTTKMYSDILKLISTKSITHLVLPLTNFPRSFKTDSGAWDIYPRFDDLSREGIRAPIHNFLTTHDHHIRDVRFIIPNDTPNLRLTNYSGGMQSIATHLSGDRASQMNKMQTEVKQLESKGAVVTYIDVISKSPKPLAATITSTAPSTNPLPASTSATPAKAQTVITLVQGNLTIQTFPVTIGTAVVDAANKNLTTGGGVAGAIFADAENLNKFNNDCQIARTSLNKNVKINGPNAKNNTIVDDGGAAIVDNYRPLAGIQWCIHAVGPLGKTENRKGLLEAAYKNSLTLADTNKVTHIAFPSISTGYFGYPIDEASSVAIDSVIDYLKNNSQTGLQEIRFVMWEYDYNTYKTKLEERSNKKIKLAAGDEDPNLITKYHEGDKKITVSNHKLYYQLK